MRIGILTGGGDAPGLNGIIEAASRVLLSHDCEVIGICDGFEGIFENRNKSINTSNIVGLHAEAGTFLGTSNKSRVEGREAEFSKKFQALKLDGLIVAGGDGTFSALSKITPSIPVIGVPKTIDNDLPGTEITFGYDTACAVVADAVDALRATAAAHRRIMIVETMGRTAGWIALGGGLASLADAILIPERPYSNEKFLNFLNEKKKSGQRGLVLVVSESAHSENEKPIVAFQVKDSVQRERFGGIAEHLARWIEKQISWEARHVVLGHLQRSRAPTTTDRFLTAALGVKAAKLALESRWNSAVVYREGLVRSVALSEIQGAPRIITTDHRWVRLAQSLEIFI